MRAANASRRSTRLRWWKLAALSLLASLAGTIAVLWALPSPALERARKHTWYRWQARMIPVAVAAEGVKLSVPFHRQEHALSCEIAALKMALNFAGVAVTEADLLSQLPFATIAPRSRDNVWGDPDTGFVGNIDGKIPNSGYGVYEAPIVALGNRYRPARAMTGVSLSELLAQVAAGRPVIVWGTLATGRDISWTTPEGKRVKAIYGEHTRVVIGFSGPPAAPRTVIMLDPIYGQITMAPSRFLANWELLDRKAVVVE